MEPVGILLDSGQLHSGADTALTVLIGLVLLISLGMLVQAWRKDREDARLMDTCPCGCGVPVSEECRSLMETPPPPVPPIVDHIGKHRRRYDGADNISVRGGSQGLPEAPDAGDRSWAADGWSGAVSDSRLLTVWGFPPHSAWGVPGAGAGGAKPLPHRTSEAVAAAASEPAHGAHGAHGAAGAAGGTTASLPVSA